MMPTSPLRRDTALSTAKTAPGLNRECLAPEYSQATAEVAIQPVRVAPPNSSGTELGVILCQEIGLHTCEQI